MRVTVGIDVGGTKILALALDPERREVLAVHHLPTPADTPALHAALAEAAEAVVAAVPGAQPAAICLGMPGFLGLDGVARQAPNLPAAVGVDVCAPLAERWGVPVFADNDANCAAWAARALDAADAATMVAVTFGTGIGGGLVVDGRLLRGGHGFAGEPGHMIVDVDGWPCVCGQRGCWEMYASGRGLGRLGQRAVDAGRAPGLAAAAAGGAVEGALVGRLALGGDPGAAAVLDEYAGWVAVGLVTLINLLDPGAVVLGGGVVDLGTALLDRIDAAMAAYPTVTQGRSVEIRLSSLGSRAGAMGAALLAAESLSGASTTRR